ncbi:MAG: hypothetical protein BWK79_10295 [Beggiatoa sp. IS2]|nr:MAG: hypothetical protein BWK79_10295 [Beggiatoa sp. IS2]
MCLEQLEQSNKPNDCKSDVYEEKPVADDCKIEGKRQITDDTELGRRIFYRIPWRLQSNERFPTMGDGNPLFELRSAQEITEDRKKIPDSFLQGRIVIIGGSYEASRDIYATPLGRMPGIWVLANATHSLLQHGELKRYEWQKWVTELVLIIIMFICFSSFWGIIISWIVVITIMIPINLLLFKYGVWLSFVLPLFSVLLHHLYERDKEIRGKLGELTMCLDIKFLIGMVGLCLLLAMPSAFATEEKKPVVVGRIEDFNGNVASFKTKDGLTVPAAYAFIRGKDNIAEEMEFFEGIAHR